MPEPQDESMPATSTPELESGSTNTILDAPENSGAAGSSAHPQSSHQPESAAADPVTLPKTLDLDSLQDLTLYELSELGHRLNVRVHADKSRHHLVFDLCKSHLERGCEITATAIVDINAQGGAFLRWGRYNFRPLPQDIQVPYHFDRQFRLQPGLQATVRVRAPPTRGARRHSRGTPVCPPPRQTPST